MPCGMWSVCISPKERDFTYKKMMKKRLSWAKEHVSWTKAQGDSVIFSNESKFNLHGWDGKRYVGRRKWSLSSRLHIAYCEIPRKPNGLVMHIQQRGWTPETVNASVYTQILGTCLKPAICDHFKSAKNCIFQQDSAACHTAKSVSTI